MESEDVDKVYDGARENTPSNDADALKDAFDEACSSRQRGQPLTAMKTHTVTREVSRPLGNPPFQGMLKEPLGRVKAVAE